MYFPAILLGLTTIASRNPWTILSRVCKRRSNSNNSSHTAAQTKQETPMLNEKTKNDCKDAEKPKEKSILNNGLVKFMLQASTLKRLANFSKGNHLQLFAYHSICFVSTYISTITPLYFAKCLDVLREQDESSYDKLFYQVALFVGLSLFSCVISYISSFLNSNIYRNIEANVQKMIFEDLLSKDLHFFENKNSQGDLLSKLFSNLWQISSYSTFQPYMRFLLNLFDVILTFGILWCTSWKLSLSICVIMPLFSIASTVFSSYYRKIADEYWDGHSDKYQIITESISNIRVVKAFSAEKKSIGILSKNLQCDGKLSKKLSTIQSLYFAFTSLCGQIGEVIALVVGGSLVLKGQLSIGELSMALMYARTFSSKASGLSRFFTDLSKSGIEVKRVFEMMDYIPSISASGGTKLEKFAGQIEFNNVSFSYPSRQDVQVLKGLCLQINPGEVIALAGASGSGKSSIITLLNRFFDPSQGSILIDGQDLKTLDLEWFHKHVGYVSQEPALMTGTIADNIAYGVESYTPEEMNSVIEKANVREFIEKKELFPKGLDTEVGEKGVKLSGGQKQRVAIARALMKNPKILIFDEATSALDAESEHQVQQAIDALMKEGKRTVILIAHRLSTIINSHRIVVMKDGEINEIGTHQNLMAKEGIYKELFERQLAGYDGLFKENKASNNSEN